MRVTFATTHPVKKSVHAVRDVWPRATSASISMNVKMDLTPVPQDHRAPMTLLGSPAKHIKDFHALRKMGQRVRMSQSAMETSALLKTLMNAKKELTIVNRMQMEYGSCASILSAVSTAFRK